jgi:hypothetical protein
MKLKTNQDFIKGSRTKIKRIKTKVEISIKKINYTKGSKTKNRN